MEDIGPAYEVFDIEVGENHNFFVGDPSSIKLGLVHNCAMDVQSVYGMYLQQRRRAKAIRVIDPVSNQPTSYLPFFERHFSTQMSATVHSLSSLEQNGSYVDTGYMQHLLGQHSPLKKILSDVQADSQKNELIQQANEMLLERKGVNSKGLFGKKPFVFEWSKDEGKQLLFIELMRLKPLRLTKTKQPAIDKFFTAFYEKEFPEVVLFSRFQRATKLLGTYVRGWHRLIMSGLDSAKDHRLRASYDFLRVLTGRLSSFDPNLQQVPSRGELVKIIKRMFVAPKGFIGIRFDYSAHEVRLWSIIACDAVLAATFKVGQELRKEWIKNPTPETAAALKQKGDIHINNVFRFWGKWVDKNDPMRDAVKSVVFGVIYGKGPSTLAKDIKDTKDKAQEIMDKMFSEFTAGSDWLNSVALQAVNNGTLMSPIGRRRNLYRVFTGIKSFVASASRRAKNSPIQGMASEIGMQAAYLILKECDQYFKDNDIPEDQWPIYSRSVHDANYYEIPYAFVLPFIHIMQYTATYGVTRMMEETYNWKFTVEPEIEVELSAREDVSFKWDWSVPQLRQHIEACVKDQVQMGILKQAEFEGVMEQILEPWRNKETRNALQEKYPLLGVPDLGKALRRAAMQEEAA